MGLIARLSVTEPVETWPGMESAAKERYWDALSLAMGETERATGAIYLFGYVAEMLVKTAYFQFIHVGRTDDLRRSLQAASRDPLWTGGNWHDLEGC